FPSGDGTGAILHPTSLPPAIAQRRAVSKLVLQGCAVTYCKKGSQHLQLKSFADFAGAQRDRVKVGRRRRVRLPALLFPVLKFFGIDTSDAGIDESVLASA